MIAPKDGIYQANLKETWSENKTPVLVEKHKNSSNTIIKTMDLASTVGSVACMGVAVASFFTPIKLAVAGTGL